MNEAKRKKIANEIIKRLLGEKATYEDMYEICEAIKSWAYTSRMGG